MRIRRFYLGIDVQTLRGCPYVVLDRAGEPVESGWLRGSTRDVVRGLAEVVNRCREGGRSWLGVGIDAPREPLPSPRQWYWDGPRGRWRPRRAADTGNGRHCEVVIAAHGLANPQWTPHHTPYPDWMQLGFALFRALANRAQAFEVFPSASYVMLNDASSVRVGIRLTGFARGPKDMLDAYVAAATVREFAEGRGSEVGGGDGFGTIVLPRPLPKPIAGVLRWPAPPPAHPRMAAHTLRPG